MMQFSEQEFRDEYRYSVIMTQYKRMLQRGLITESDYLALNRKYKEKYRPVTDGIIAEYGLLCSESRALMLSGKEAVKCPR